MPPPHPDLSCLQVARQALHADRGFFPSCDGYFNAIICLDAMHEANGATRLVCAHAE